MNIEKNFNFLSKLFGYGEKAFKIIVFLYNLNNKITN